MPVSGGARRFTADCTTKPASRIITGEGFRSRESSYYWRIISSLWTMRHLSMCISLFHIDTSLTLFCSLKDLVVRTETNKLVTDLVNLDRVRSLLKTISHRRRFLRHLEEQRKLSRGQQQHDVPSIYVDATPVTPPMPSRDISSYGMGGYYDSAPNTPSPRRVRQGHARDASLTTDRLSTVGSPSIGGAGLQRSSRRTSDISLSTDLGYKSWVPGFLVETTD